jgi:hypothetical protein
MKNLTTKVRRLVSPMRRASRFVERLCNQETVLQGPFSGMRLSVETSFTPFRALLLGSYEKELWQQIRHAIGVCDGSIVVGAAEGYYAVGLTKLADGKKVIAFEMDPKGLRLLKKNAKKNQVGQRLEIFGKCDGPALRNAVRRFSHPFVIIDVEGAEAEILAQADGSVFDQATLLIEIHDFVDRSLGEAIHTRFRESHSITEIWQQPRHPVDLPQSLPFRRILWRWYRTLISENRPEKMRWFYLTPKILLRA